MTELLCLNNSYLKEFDAKVVSIKEDKFIELDKTAFYPQGGGQPFDTGILIFNNQEYKVVAVKKQDGIIYHEVDKPGLKQDDLVHGTIDWDRRYKLMRMHTTAHMLAAIFHKDAGALITGNQLDIEKSRIDFSLENFDRNIIDQYVTKANQLASSGIEVTTSSMPREEALKIPGMVKLAGVLPPTVIELRIVKIGEVDEQADGGTHVKNTKEIGTIKILELQNKGKNNRRVYFTVE